MDYKENIKNVLDFIDQNIKTDISVKHLSQTSSFSIPHLYRLFKQYCGCSPVEYIQKRKLYLAAGELISGKRRIIDVALDYGFDSHDVFTRAFKRIYDINPEYYRRYGYCLPDFEITLSKNNFKEYDDMHNVEIVTFPKTYLIGVENRLHVDEWAPDVFHRMYESVFMNVSNLVHPPVECSKRPYTCATHIMSILQPDGSYNYFAGVEVTDFSDIPKAEGVITRIIPEMMCAAIGYEGGLDFKEISGYLYGEWLDNNIYLTSNDENNPYCPIEWYSPGGFDIYEERIYMPIKPIRYDIKKENEYKGVFYRAVSSDNSENKSKAFDIMLKWAKDNNLFTTIPVKFEVRYGKIPDGNFYCEVFYRTNKDISEFINDYSIKPKTYPDGLYAIAPIIHAFLKPQIKAVLRMLGRNEKYNLIGGCHEEYILDKPSFDHFTKVNFYEGIKRR